MENAELIWKLREPADFLWLYLPLIFALLLIISVRFLNAEYFGLLFTGITNNINIELYATQDLQTGKINTTLLLLVNAISVSTGVYIYADTYLNMSLEWVHFLILPFAYLFVIVLKWFSLHFFSWVTEVNAGIRESKYNILVFFETAALLSIALAFFIVYSKKEIQYFFIWSLFLTQAMAYILFLISGVRHAIKNKIPFLFIFLYLCTLEILPFVVIIYYFNVKFQ